MLGIPQEAFEYAKLGISGAALSIAILYLGGALERYVIRPRRERHGLDVTPLEYKIEREDR